MKKFLSILLAIAIIFSSASAGLGAVDFSSLFAVRAEAADEVPDGYIGVYTVDDLYNIRNGLTSNYILMNDIDLSEATSIDGDFDFNDSGWDPIGSNGIYGSGTFSGIFDGSGYTISGMRIDVSSIPSGTGTMYIGLFGRVSGTIKNLTVSGTIKSDAAKTKYVGSIVGFLNGVLENCHSDCEIIVSNNTNEVGGLAGRVYDTGKITLCSNRGNISGATNAGGIAGYSCNRNTIEKCYNTGNIDGTDCGGIVGYWYVNTNSYVGYINDCYNSGSISGTNCGGIVGKEEGYSAYGYTGKVNVTDCYNVGSLSGSEKNVSIINGTSYVVTTCYYLEGLGDSQTGATARNDAMMKKQISYTGFDFDTVWTIDSTCEYPYPQLKDNVHAEEIGVKSISIKTLPKTQYYKDDVIDVTGGVLTVELLDGTVYDVEIPDSAISAVDMTTYGTKTVTITYKGATTSYDITVSPRLVDLTIESLPDKISYIQGQNIDTTGLVVKATYDDGTTEYITDYVLSYDNTVVGEQAVEVSCGDVTASFTVSFLEGTLVSIAVTKMPDKTTYIVGESFDNTGMVVTATYDNGLTADVTDYTISGFSSTKAGTKTVIITYSGKRVSIKVTVEEEVIEEEPEKVPVSMNIINEPDKFEYVSGEAFDPTGMIVKVTFSDGTVEEVTDYEIEGFGDFYCDGDCEVIVKYGDFTGTIFIIYHNTENGVSESPATCTEDGVREYYCEECDDIVKTEILPATGHNSSEEWTIDVQVTCTENGSKSRKCLNCGEKADITEIIATGHTEVIDEAVAATCTATGLTEGKHCSVCDEVITAQEIIPMKEHNYDESDYKYAQNPENANEYLKQYECEDCGFVISAEEKYVPIRTVADLYQISNNLSGNFVMLNSLDLTEATSATGGWSYNGYGWDPIGTNANGFSGIFDGNGYSIIGLRITSSVPSDVVSNSKYYGLFAVNNGVIKNLRMVDANVSGSYMSTSSTGFAYVGSICGLNNGTIENCSASGMISTNSSFSWSQSTSNLSGTTTTYYRSVGCAGGITGKNAGTVSRCYNLATIACTDNYESGTTYSIEYYTSSLGGIVGCAADGTVVSECFNGGEFNGVHKYYSSTTYGSGIVGKHDGTDTVINCYSIVQNKGLSASKIVTSYYKLPTYSGGYYYDASGKSYSLTDTQMEYASLYTGFDFENIWFMDDSDGYLYPQLRNNPHREAECAHTYGEWVVDTEATCTTDGSKHKECTSCGATETETIPATGHNYSTEWTIDVQATCTTNGSKSHHCLNCGNKNNVTDIIATGHIVGEWIVDVEATCTTDGSKYKECTVCGETLETETIPVIDHKESDWLIEVDATCSFVGSKYKECTVCGEILETGIIPVIDHKESDWIIDVGATCTTDGSKHKQCTVCGESVKAEVIPAGHSYSTEWTIDAQATCTENGSKSRHCLDCDDKTDVTEIIATGHSYGDWVYDNEQGIKTCECNICGYVLIEDINENPYLTFTLSDDGTYYSVTDCDESAAGVMAIPSTHKGLPVTNIGASAFAGCSDIIEVIIPDSVKSIGATAFKECTSLNSLTMGEGVTSVGKNAFSSCSNLAHVYITDLTKWCNISFSYAVSILSKTDFSNPLSNGASLYLNGEMITDLVIPEGVTKIGDAAFYGLINVKSVVIPEGVVSIGENSFNNCTDLESMVIPVSATTIDKTAVKGCSKLVFIFYPGTDTQWNDINFTKNALNLTNENSFELRFIHYELTDHILNTKTVVQQPTCTQEGVIEVYCDECYMYYFEAPVAPSYWDMLYPDVLPLVPKQEKIPALGHDFSAEWIIEAESTCVKEGSRYRYCSSCGEVEFAVIEKTEHNYGDVILDYDKNVQTRECSDCGYVLEEAISLEGILTFTISEDGTYYSLTGCNETAIGVIDIPSTYKGLPVTSIGASAFSGCADITSVRIPVSVSSISSTAFDSCAGLLSIVVDEGNANYTSLDGVLFSKDGKTLVKYPSGKTDAEYIISDAVTSIGSYAFADCTNLKILTMSDSITKVGTYAFENCNNLSRVNVSDIAKWCQIEFGTSLVTSGCNPLEYGALYVNGERIVDLVIPEGITTIKRATFRGATSINSVAIPSTVTSIEGYAFYKCDNLWIVFYAGTKAQWESIDIKGYSGESSIITLNSSNKPLYDALKHYETTWHIMSEWEVVKQPTCTKEGTEERYCEICYEVFSGLPEAFSAAIYKEKRLIPALGHDYDYENYEIINNPENNKEYLKQYTCTRCGDITIDDEACIIKNLIIECEPYILDYTEGETIDTTGLIVYAEFENGTLLNVTSYDLDYDNTVYGEQDVIVSLGDMSATFTVMFDHSAGSWIIEKPATCTENGLKKLYCTECGELIQSTTILALDHSYGEYTYDYSANTQTHECTVCGYVETEEIYSADKLKFTLSGDGAYYSVAAKNSSISGDVVIPSTYKGLPVTTLAKNAFYDCYDVTSVSIPSSITTVEKSAFTHISPDIYLTDLTVWCNTEINATLFGTGASPTANGGKLYLNGELLTEIIIPDGVTKINNFTFYNYDDITKIVIPKSVTSIGSSAFKNALDPETEYVFYEGSEEEWANISGISQFSDIIVHYESTDHSSEQWLVKSLPTCTQEGLKEKHCDFCDILLETEIVPKTEHVSGNWVIDTEATCLEDGYRYQKCIFCQAEVASEVILATGHTFSEWITEPEATCESDGAKHRLCVSCGKVEQETVPAKGHNYSTEWTIDAQATCTENGSKSRHCLNCDSKTDVTEIVAIGHTYGEWAYDNEAGTKTCECTVCGDVLTEKITVYPYLTFILSDDGTYYSVAACDTSITGEIVIPGEYNGKPVKKIANDGFRECKNITSVVISEGVEEIGSYAFAYCSSLDAITIPSTITHIYNMAFFLDSNLRNLYITDIGAWCQISFSSNYSNPLYNSSSYYSNNIYIDGVLATDIVIPEGVTRINDYAFYNFTCIKTVEIPESVISIGVQAFTGCNNLSSIDVDEANEKYLSADGVLFNKNQTELIFYPAKKSGAQYTVPDTVTKIHQYAFNKCDNLTYIKLSEGIKSLNAYTVYSCSNLATLALPASLKQLSVNAIYGCSKLKNIYIADLTSWCNVEFVKEMFYSFHELFKYAENVYINGELATDIVIPDGVGSINAQAFYGYKGLNSIAIPESVTYIGESAFGECTNLKYGFYEGTQDEWEQIIIESGNDCLTGLQMHFESTGHTCSSEWTIDKVATCTENGSKSHHCLFCDAKTDITEIVATGHSYGDWEYDERYEANKRECAACGDIIIDQDESLDYLTFTLSDDGTYYSVTACKQLAIGIIRIPSKYNGLPVKAIGKAAFNICESITKVIIPESVETIGDSAFRQCLSMTSIVIPDTVTRIGRSAFSQCFSLESVEIPCGITSIEELTFYGCESLTEIIIPDTVKEIGKSAFACSGIKSIVIPDSVETIGDWILEGCNKLESVEFGKNITCIPEGCFAGSGIKSFTIPETITVIEDFAFGECMKLSEVVIPDSVVSIGTEAFVTCHALKSIVIPDSVASLGDMAFAMCTSLNSIVLSEGITVLGESTFGMCSSLESVVIKGELTSIGDGCFYECGSLKYIFYAHSEEDWNDVVIAEEENDSLNNAIIHYNSIDHTYEWTIIKEGSCTEYGEKIQECIYCDFPKTTEIIPATGHEYGEWTIVSEATCEKDGYRYRTCASCQATESESFVATGHKYLSEWIIGKEATCEEDGERYRQCYACNAKMTEVIVALGHNYSKEFTVDIEATCQTQGSKSRHCTRCDSKINSIVIPKTDHSYTEWLDTNPATCESDGERAMFCLYCDDAIFETVAALGHSYSARWTTDKTPTCTVAGSKSHHCNRPSCNSKIDVTVIPALGHNFGEWEDLETTTCTVNGQRLRMCNTCYVEEVETIKAPGHSYGEWTVESAADCTTDGKRHATCDVCGYVNNETVKAYGHDYEAVFTVDEEATCTEVGSKSRHCSRCEDKTDVTEVLALGHHISTMWTIDVEPTCESEGEKSHHCLRCDAISDVTPIPVASHIYGKWYVVTEATMDEAGVRAHKCYNCEMTEEAELPKLLKYTATFVADGDVVATVDFPEDATEIDVPEVPHKDKFNGEWENFEVRNKNFTVNAVYTVIPAEEKEGLNAGNKADYYSSTGEVEVNLNVSAQSKTIVTTTTKSVPLDIIFVLDQSGSMADGGKKTALKNAVTSFSNAILEDAQMNSVDHRIAVVGFASGNNDWLNYENTELLTTDVVKYNKITNADYKNALVSVNDDGKLNNVITNAVKAIDAEGATRADLGLEMASNIFAQNPVTDDRQRVVVFLTDGVPTSYSNFEYSVANVAIKNAYQLKNTYDATVYSVGVFDRTTSANRSVNNFMNYVSSNYISENQMSVISWETTENIGGYYLDVSDVDTLTEVFTSIVEETTTHTGRFTNATLKYTLTKYFTLTSAQEDAVRSKAMEKLGVSNDQIAITRNADGTTTIVINGVEPWLEDGKFVIDFTFRATANEKTLKSGTYQVGTFESGIILENGEGYEAVFAPNSVDIGGTSGIAVFNINGIPYAINRLSSTTKVVAPATSFGADYNFIGWSVPENLTLNNEVRVFDAELLVNEYKISWNIDGEIIEEIYAVGDFITVPQVGSNSIGGAFVGWDKTIPEKMPSENLTITAVYDAHYHSYNVTKDFELCTEGGTQTYTCDCGDTYTEEIAPCEHSWEVITASNNQNAIENAGSRCSVCGIKDSKALRLEGKDTHQEPDASYNTATVELDYVDENGDKHQPEGDIEISVQLDEVFENQIPDDATANVYRVNDDGSRTLLESEQNGMNMTFITDHFSTYEFEFTTGEQRYLFAQNGSKIDYANKLIFSNTYLAKGFKSIVTYLLPATIKANVNEYGYFGTGTSIDLSKDDATDNFKVIVNGDLNGDGVCDVVDAAYAARVSSGYQKATEDEIYAANGYISDELDVNSYQNVVNMALAS